MLSTRRTKRGIEIPNNGMRPLARAMHENIPTSKCKREEIQINGRRKGVYIMTLYK